MEYFAKAGPAQRSSLHSCPAVSKHRAVERFSSCPSSPSGRRCDWANPSRKRREGRSVVFLTLTQTLTWRGRMDSEFSSSRLFFSFFMHHTVMHSLIFFGCPPRCLSFLLFSLFPSACRSCPIMARCSSSSCPSCPCSESKRPRTDTCLLTTEMATSLVICMGRYSRQKQFYPHIPCMKIPNKTPSIPALRLPKCVLFFLLINYPYAVLGMDAYRSISRLNPRSHLPSLSKSVCISLAWIAWHSVNDRVERAKQYQDRKTK